MTPARTYTAAPFPVALGPVGAQSARCRVCGLVPGWQAWADHRLLGLYCGPGCCQAALLEVEHRAPIGYAPEGRAA